MKLLFILLCLCTSFVQAQYQPSLTELSGNGITADGRGYIYNFGGDEKANCFYSQFNDSYNQAASKHYSYVLDTLNGFFKLSFSGNQENAEVLCNHFTAGNCDFLENSTSGYLNLSNVADQVLEIKVRSNVRVERFGVLIAANDEHMIFQLGDGSDHEAVELLPNKWKTLTIPLIFERWDHLPLDPARTMGVAFYARNASDPQPKGAIEIDYIRVGSAVKRYTPSGTPSPSLKGYTFGFKGDDLHTCYRQFNTTGNSSLSLKVDAATHLAVLTQKVTPSRYDIYGLEFADADCFLKTISLQEEKLRFIEIKIKPDKDIVSFGLSVSGKDIGSKLWNYSNTVEYVPLKGGTWNIVKVPVSMDTQTGGKLDPSRIGGVVLAVNPHSENETTETSPVSVSYTIEYIKVGDAIGK